MKSNCVIYAVREFIRAWRKGEEAYLCFRTTRVKGGVLHCLVGKLDELTDQVAVRSYKPPAGHKKRGFAPLFHGSVVHGDRKPVKSS